MSDKVIPPICGTCQHSHIYDGPLKPYKPVDTPCWKCGCDAYTATPAGQSGATMSEPTAEQQARDMLEQCGVEDAQSFTAGDVVALANLIFEADRQRRQLAAIRKRCVDFTPDPSVIDEILAILNGKFR